MRAGASGGGHLQTRRDNCKQGNMNVFLLCKMAREAARGHSNKHVVKMILEMAQLLCTAHAVLDHNGAQVPVSVFGDGEHSAPPKTYKPTHRNHPWAVAVRRDEKLYAWVAQLGLALCREYSKRYAGKKHASQHLLECLLRVPPRKFRSAGFVPEAFTPKTATRRITLRSGDKTLFAAQVPLAMPAEYAEQHECAVQAYRSYYHSKDAIHTWEPRAKVPEWYAKATINC